MTITTTIPDDAVSAWQARVDQFNAGSGEKPITIEQFAQMNRDIETAGYVTTYETDQLTKLAPLSARYLAAPDSVKLEVDAALAPYDSAA